MPENAERCEPHRHLMSNAQCRSHSLRSDRRRLRSQNIFLNFGGRSFGYLFDEGHTVRRLEVRESLTRGASIAFEPEYQLLSNVEAIKVHHLGPGRDEVVHKFFLTVGAAVNFGQCAENGVGTKDKIDACAGPFEFAG